jgi:hypothetical protein
MDDKEFRDLSERLARLEGRWDRLEERWELSVQTARLEERLNAAAQAVPLVAEPLKVQALELSRRVVGLETAKNESTGKSSGFSTSWGIILAIATVGFLALGSLVAAAALLMHGK